MKKRGKEGVWYVVVKGKRDKRRAIERREQEIVRGGWGEREGDAKGGDTVIHSDMSSQRKKG